MEWNRFIYERFKTEIESKCFGSFGISPSDMVDQTTSDIERLSIPTELLFSIVEY